MIIVDASVAVKWFLPEPLSGEAEALLRSDEVRAAPEHVLVEVGQALLRASRKGEVARDHVVEAVAALRGLLHLVPTADLVARALEIAFAASCTLYDTLYVAAAEQQDGRVVTADRRLVTALTATPWQGRIILLGDGSVGQGSPA